MESIKSYLKKEHNLILLDEINSTNDYAKNLARNGEKSGTVIIAKKQTAGKGRLGRSFCSPDGTGLYMSIILRPDCAVENISLLTSCMAVAAARGIDNLYGTDMKIKWVNDLYLNSKKISGILTEGAVTPDGKPDFAIVGIGVNIKSVKNCFSADLLEIASSLEDETGKVFSVSEIAAEIINQTDLLFPHFEKAEYIKEYRERSCITGCDVIILKENRDTIAKAIGISDRAGLIVRYADGSEEILTSGEARIKKS